MISPVDPGAALQLGHAGHAAEHPSSENAAEETPQHQLQLSRRSSGSAGETGIHGVSELHAALHHS